MIKIGSIDLTNFVPFNGITDGLEVVQSEQPQGSILKSSHYNYQIQLKYVNDDIKSKIENIISSDSVSCVIGDSSFLGYISSFSSVRSNKTFWDITLNVIDLS